MKLNTILCAIDKSDSAVNALDFAKKLAQKYNAQLQVVHVFGSDLRMKPEYKAEKSNELLAFLKSKNVNVDVQFLDGYISDAICEAAKSCDLIVMGLRGANHTSNYYGSNAAQTLHSAKKPVFLLPNKPISANFKKIAFATDFKDLRADETLEYLRDLVSHDDAELHLLHISREDGVLDTLQGEEALELHEAFDDLNHAFFMVKDKDIIHGIATHFKEKQVDLLAIMPRKTKGFANTLSQALVEGLKDIPIFSFHA